MPLPEAEVVEEEVVPLLSQSQAEEEVEEEAAAAVPAWCFFDGPGEQSQKAEWRRHLVDWRNNA